MELFWVNGWLFCQGHRNPDNWNVGTVYFPKGETTLPIASNYGIYGDTFATLAEAKAYYEREDNKP